MIEYDSLYIGSMQILQARCTLYIDITNILHRLYIDIAKFMHRVNIVYRDSVETPQRLYSFYIDSMWNLKALYRYYKDSAQTLYRYYKDPTQTLYNIKRPYRDSVVSTLILCAIYSLYSIQTLCRQLRVSTKTLFRCYQDSAQTPYNILRLHRDPIVSRLLQLRIYIDSILILQRFCIDSLQRLQRFIEGCCWLIYSGQTKCLLFSKKMC